MIDRGMMRWVPFSAIKEQFEGINELHEKQSHIAMPILDEQQLESLNLTVCEAIAENKQVSISYQKQNKAHSEIGYIHYYDMSRNELRVIDRSEKVLYININYITDMKCT